MYCIAREQKTTYCVIYCNTPLEKALSFNKMNNNKFSDELVQELFKRMEAPQLKSKSFCIKIDGIFPYSKEEISKKPLSKKQPKPYCLRQKNPKIQYQQNKIKNYQKTIYIKQMRFVQISVKKPAQET